MEALMDKYLAEGDQEGIRKINEELETLGVHISTKQSTGIPGQQNS